MTERNCAWQPTRFLLPLRWSIRLLPYRFVVKFRKGSDNPTDYFSSKPIGRVFWGGGDFGHGDGVFCEYYCGEQNALCHYIAGDYGTELEGSIDGEVERMY